MIHQPNFPEAEGLRVAQLKMLNMLKAVTSICDKHGLDYWLEGGTLLGAIRQHGFIEWDDDLDISMPRASFEAFLKIAPQELPASMSIQTKDTDKGYFNFKVPLKIRDNNSRYIAKHEAGREPYHQGIYMDIFPYDKTPSNPFKRKFFKLVSRKLLRVLYHKYGPSYLFVGHHRDIYKNVGKLMPKSFLEKIINWLITNSNNSASPYLGYGYDTINPTYFTFSDFYPLKKASFEGAEFNIPNNFDKILRAQFGDYWIMPPKHKRGLKHCKELIAHIEDKNVEFSEG